VLDCAHLTVSTASFVDEVVKEVLIERNAARLDLIDATPKTETHVRRSAQNRGVSERVQVALRI